MNLQIDGLTVAIRLAAYRELLSLITRAPTDRIAGRRALLLAFILDPGLIGPQRELARRMGVSEARASQMLKTIRREFGK